MKNKISATTVDSRSFNAINLSFCGYALKNWELRLPQLRLFRFIFTKIFTFRLNKTQPAIYPTKLTSAYRQN